MKTRNVKAFCVLLSLLALLSASCAMGIMGSSVPAATYKLTTTLGTWTMVLANGSFDYSQKASNGTTVLSAYKGTFTALADQGDSVYVGTLTTFKTSTDGITYTDVTLASQSIKLSYYSSLKKLSFYLDGDGDGLYKITDYDDVVVLTMEQQ